MPGASSSSTTVWGRLSDRFGRKPILIITNGGTAIAYLLMAFAPDVWVLAAGRALSGLMGGLAPAMAYVSDVTPPEKRAQGMGWVGACHEPRLSWSARRSAACSAAAMPARRVCWCLAWWPLPSPPARPWRRSVFLKESLPPEKRAAAAVTQAQGGSPGFSELVRRPLMARLLVLGFFVYVAMAMFETIFPFWTKAQFQWGPREVGLSFTYLAVVVGIMQGLVVGRLAPVFGEGRLAITGLACYAVGLVWMTQSPSWHWMMVGVTLTSGGGGTFLTAMSSFVSRLAGANERGLVLGTYQSASWAGRSLGPVMSGTLFNSLGVHSPLLVGAVLMLPCIALLGTIMARNRLMSPREAG